MRLGPDSLGKTPLTEFVEPRTLRPFVRCALQTYYANNTASLDFMRTTEAANRPPKKGSLACALNPLEGSTTGFSFRFPTSPIVSTRQISPSKECNLAFSSEERPTVLPHPP